MSEAGERARAVRRAAGLFAPEGRALLEVSGGDRVRWLQGQITNDVAKLAAGQGCYALVLTVKGRIVADLHVLARDDRFWLETGLVAREAVRERLERYIVADDVALFDATERFARLALEGPAAERILAAAAGGAAPPAPEAACELALAGRPALAWAFGFTGLPGFQLLLAPDALEATRAALIAAGREHGLVEAGAATREILRVESGVPALASELHGDVFPAEARVAERAVSFAKGCYTGQEIVERIRSRGNVNHQLVGLRFEGEPPAPDSALETLEGKRVGEVTSVARSPEAGAIGLGYLRREHETPGTVLRCAAGTVRVVALPIVGPASAP